MEYSYFPNDAKATLERMLRTIGVASIEDLFRDIPRQLRLQSPLKLPRGGSEAEVRNEIEQMLNKNLNTRRILSFLGGGVWQHYVPAVVDYVAERAEFLTSYTPYQAEVSQGLLQVLFEFQSLLCELMEMDVANCGMYDWASALGEAARMSMRTTQRSSILVPRFIHPERLRVLKAYAEPAGARIVEVKNIPTTGQIDLEDLKSKLTPDTAAVYVENPSYLGPFILDADAVGEVAHDTGALLIAGVDPATLGVVKGPGSYGADIAIGEGQPLGSYMNLGGPLLGLFACRDERNLIRQMPGRLVGLTTVLLGDDRAYCLALQAREQHIRREKATSNICTNHALLAVRAAVYLALLGGGGLRRLAERILENSTYAIKQLSRVEGVKAPALAGSHFKDFTVNFDAAGKTAAEVNGRLLTRGILGGKSLSSDFPELGESALYSVTEIHSREEIDRLTKALAASLKGA